MKIYRDLLEAAEQMKEARCFLFDMDGLIFDTERLFMEQLAVVMAERGYVLTREVYEKSLGMAGDALKELMCGIYGENYPFYEMGQESRRRVSVVAETVGLRVKPQIRELAEQLRQQGKLCAVASSTASEYVRKYLEQAGLAFYFSQVIGGEMVTHSKPEPEIFLMACQKCEVKPSEAVVLEDSENGIRAAYVAGIRSICIPDLKEPCDEVRNMIDIMVVHP